MRLKTILVFITCFFIGSSIITLAKSSTGRYLFLSPRVLEDYKVTIEGEEREIESLLNRIDESTEELRQLLIKRASNQDVAKEVEAKLFQELSFYSLSGGFVDVEGPGIEILLDDATREVQPWDNPNDMLVHDLDLLEVVNELKNAGAEVISVNGQRILDSSSITCSGYTVRINGRFYGKPFRISAIGDASRMSAALIGPGGYGTYLKDYGLTFKVTIRDVVVISANKEDRSFKFTSPIVLDKKKEGAGN